MPSSLPWGFNIQSMTGNGPVKLKENKIIFSFKMSRNWGKWKKINGEILRDY